MTRNAGALTMTLWLAGMAVAAEPTPLPGSAAPAAPMAPAAAMSAVTPPAATPPPNPAPTDIEPAVVTSNAVAPKPAVSNSRAATRAMDRVELENTQITGNRELPRVMYVVPWKKPDLGQFAGRPAKSLLDELLAPVDRDVFKRQNRYFDALKPDAAAVAPPTANGSNENPGAAAPRAGDEK